MPVILFSCIPRPTVEPSTRQPLTFSNAWMEVSEVEETPRGYWIVRFENQRTFCGGWEG